MGLLTGPARGGRTAASRLPVAAVVLSAGLAGAPAPVSGGHGAAPGPLHGVPGRDWTLHAPARPAGSAWGALAAVSCTSAGSCMAAGSYQGSSRVSPLAQRWDGTGWTTVRPPDPVSSSAGLAAVSCPSARFCMAAGSYRNGLTVTLAQRWDGSGWTTVHVPDPAGTAGDGLAGVSCVSPSACTAVGEYASSTGTAIYPLAERWDGSTWTIEHVPDPAGTDDGELQAVSCAAAAACTAVGYVLRARSVIPLAERWDGTAWLPQGTPALAGDGYLQGVSCASVTACTAVGYARDSQPGGLAALAESWNGHSWVVQPVPEPATDSYLDGVSCAGAGSCAAVGGFLDSASRSQPLAEEWNGVAWEPVGTARPAGTTSDGLAGVSCPPGAGECAAVGYHNTAAGVVLPLAETGPG